MRESLGSFVRVVSANKKVRSQFEGVYNSTGNHLLCTQQNANAQRAKVIMEQQEVTER